MTTSCLICLEPLRGSTTYHRSCVAALFGGTRVPRIDVDQAKLHTLAGAMVEHTSLSGTQRKISLGFTQDRAFLRVPNVRGEYILKPQTGVYPSMPENEHLTMRLAALFGLEIPPCGLVQLDDTSLAFIVRRFDRPDDGKKLRQDDFCQLAVEPPKAKYDGSAELCARLIRRYSDQPGIDLLKLFRQLVFSWWVGNGDLHLKNLSLLGGSLGDVDAPHRLSPAYDLVASCLVIANDRMALQMGGRDRRLARAAWVAFARYCDITDRAAARVLAQPGRLLERAEQVVARSFLPEMLKREYGDLLRERTASFTA